MSKFAALELRVNEACIQHGRQKAAELVRSIGSSIGYGNSPPEEFYDAIKPLRDHAAGLLAQREMNRIWGQAETAAIAVLKGELK